MHLTKLALIPVILSLAALPACGGKKSKKRKVSSPASKVEYFVHGNPSALIAGSTRNTTSFLKATELERYQNFTLSGYTAFTEKSEKKPPSNWDQVEAENSTESEESQVREAFELSDYQFVRLNDKSWSYQGSNPQGIKLTFTEANGVLSLSRFNGFLVEAQHYSLKNDGSAFSILFSANSVEDGQVLVSLTFASNADVQELEFAPEAYSFLIGSAKVSWKEPLKLQACGKFSPQEKASIEFSVDAWFKDKEATLATSHTPLSFSFTETYAPFSDLNQQCIHLARNFKAESSEDFYIAGLAASSFNMAKKSLIDSDIFIFVDHAPVRQQLTAGDSETLVHEIGHYLGLGHEFRTDASDKALHPSIMGYSQGTTSISDWDFAAVRTLYGAPLQKAPAL